MNCLLLIIVPNQWIIKVNQEVIKKTDYQLLILYISSEGKCLFNTGIVLKKVNLLLKGLF